MQIPNSFSPIAETLTKIPQTKVAKLIGVLLLGYIAYLFAQITWLVFDKPNGNNSVISKTSQIQKGNEQSINIAGIRSLNLFGAYSEIAVVETPQEIEDAPETNLNLTLTGVVASNVEKRSAAIIQHNGTQEIYAIDETINGTRAVLKNVFNDRVHIKHSGRLETLMLDGFDYGESQNQRSSVASKPSKTRELSGPQPSQKGTNLVDQRSNKDLTKQAIAFKDDINSDPGKITDYLKIAPKREDGNIIGYQLMPGKNPDFFRAAGLKSGDVAIQMNGLDLSQPSEAAQALIALKEERDVSLLLNRNGDITEILFSIDE